MAAGTGTVYSYVVHRHPPVPGKQLPLVIALVELTEGPRLMAELTGIDPGDVRIGMPVRATFLRVDDGLVLPAWRPTSPARCLSWRLPVTPTVVVSTAIATRDFYPVHHDRDFAVRSGSRDIFLNILTSTGLVARYVTDWAGPEAAVRWRLDPPRRSVLRRRHAGLHRSGSQRGGRRAGHRGNGQLQYSART